jgi:hypothetical protein
LDLQPSTLKYNSVIVPVLSNAHTLTFAETFTLSGFTVDIYYFFNLWIAREIPAASAVGSAGGITTVIISKAQIAFYSAVTS